jgi:mannose-6-phosphate isomerase
MKVVEKPWGKEQWLSLDERFCCKIITVFKGCGTSLQYHNNKSETTYISSGRALFSFKNEKGELEKKEVGPGFYVYLKPGDIHRFEALEEVVLFEASTPEVHDVVRLEDSYGREGTSNP